MDLTNGPLGLPGIPRPQLFGIDFSQNFNFPHPGSSFCRRFLLNNKINNYFSVWQGVRVYKRQ